MDFTIRAAELDDSDAIGAAHVRAWQAAYRGVMPDDYLDGLRAEDRATLWRRHFANPRREQMLTVIDYGGEVVGFAASGPEAGDSAPRDVGELYAINLDPSRWGQGLGRALLRDVTTALGASGYRSAVLWVEPSNVRARSLYESEGWVDDHTARQQEVLGATVSEVRYRRALGT